MRASITRLFPACLGSLDPGRSSGSLLIRSPGLARTSVIGPLSATRFASLAPSWAHGSVAGLAAPSPVQHPGHHELHKGHHLLDDLGQLRPRLLVLIVAAHAQRWA